MKKMIHALLCALVITLYVPFFAHTSEQTGQQSSTLEDQSFEDKKISIDSLKNFFQKVGDLKIGARSVSYLFWCEFFNLNISFKDLSTLKNFVDQNRPLISKLLTTFQKLYEKLLTKKKNYDQFNNISSYNTTKLVEQFFTEFTPALDVFEQIISLIKNHSCNVQIMFNLPETQLHIKHLLNKKNQETIEKIIDQKLNQNEIQTLINFLQTGILKRIYEQIINYPQGFLNLLRNILQIHGKKLEELV